MANISIVENRNFDDSYCQTLNAIETITIYSGYQLTMNSDTRWGQNGSVFGGNSVIDANTGGTLFVDGTTVRWIGFSNGAGNVPPRISGYIYPYPSGVIGLSSNVSGEYLGIWSTTLGTAPIAGGTAMSATGYVKLRSATGTYTIGEWIRMPGNASGVVTSDEVGWLNIVGAEAGNLSVPRLGTFKVSGLWFTLGYGTGTASQTVQHYVSDIVPALWIETASGSNIYGPWVDVYQRLATANLSGGLAAPGIGPFGNVFSSTSGGLCTFGNAATGNWPIAGARIRVPNVHLSSSISPYSVNSVPPVLATRYDFTATNAGNFEINTAIVNWYFGGAGTMLSPYSIHLRDMATPSAMTINECGSRILLSGVVVAPCVANDQIPITLTDNFFGADILNCKFFRYSAGATSYGLSATQVYDVILSGCYFWHCDGTSTQTSRIGISLSQCQEWTISACQLSNCRTLLAESSSVSFYNHKVGDAPLNLSTRTIAGAIGLSVGAFSSNILIDGWGTPSGCYPMYNVAAIDITASTDVTIQNIGSVTSPFDAKSMSSTFITLGTGRSKNVQIKRVYANNLRASATALFTDTNSNNEVIFQNFGSTTEAVTAPQALNGLWKGNRFNTAANIGTTFAAMYGTHFYDYFIADTSGYIGLIFNEKTTTEPSASAYTVSGSAYFTSTGKLALITNGDAIIYEWPHYILGYSGLGGGFTPQITGTNTGKHFIYYDLDKNDGNGFTGTYTVLTNSALSAESGISPTLGFKPRIKIQCTSSNASNAITGVYFLGLTNIGWQVSGLYPLETVAASLVLNDLQVNSEIKIFNTGTITELGGVEDSSTSFTYNYTWTGTDIPVDIVIHHRDYQYLRYENISLGQDGLTLPIQQIFDRNYSNP